MTRLHRSSAHSPRPAVALIFALVVALPACAASPTSHTSNQTAPIPGQGTPSTLDVGNWNLEWFGDPSHGPANDTLQLDHVRAVMAGTDLDIWGLEEVVSAGEFASLLAGLPGYAGMLANDPFVKDGPAYYSDFDNMEQKVALVYRTDEVSLDSARVILTDQDYACAGRPPVAFHLSVTLDSATEHLILIVMHAKAGSDAASRDRRDTAAAALKAYLDATWPAQKVLVIGDFNDDVDTSITPGQPSPYRYFVADSADYDFPTATLSEAGDASTVSFPDVIDHQLDSNETFADYIRGSAEIFRADRYISDYGNTTSDHYPVIVRYRVAAGG
ncbi:MAG: endonuclease/exonuclease/phosphatase family protein [Gemmatimonadota bacterium]|jgi:endonuclease/exonuclease/phosphatase family metal-dependent hydrolase